MNCEDILLNSRTYINSLHAKVHQTTENFGSWTAIREIPPIWDEDLIKEHVREVVDQFFQSPPSKNIPDLKEKVIENEIVKEKSIESPGENEIKALWKPTKYNINVYNNHKDTKTKQLKSPTSTRTVDLRKKLNDSNRTPRTAKNIHSKLREYEKPQNKNVNPTSIPSHYLRFIGKPASIPIDFSKEHPDLVIKYPMVTDTLFPCRYEKTDDTITKELFSTQIANDNKIDKKIKKRGRQKLVKTNTKILKSLIPQSPNINQPKVFDKKATWHEVLLEKRNFSKDLPDGKQQLNEKIITLRENSFIPTTQSIDPCKIVIENYKLMNDNNENINKQKNIKKNDDCYSHEKICLERNKKINKNPKSIDVISDKLGKVTQYTEDIYNDKCKKKLLKVQKLPVFCIRGECKVQKVVEIEIKPNLTDLSDYRNSKENSNVQYFQFVHENTFKHNNNNDVDNKKVGELSGGNIFDKHKNINYINPKELQTTLNFEITDNDKENNKEKDNKKSGDTNNKYFTAFSKYIDHQILSDPSDDYNSNKSFQNLDESLTDTTKDGKLSFNVFAKPKTLGKSYIIDQPSTSDIFNKIWLENPQKPIITADSDKATSPTDIVHTILNSAFLSSNKVISPNVSIEIPKKSIPHDDIHCKEISTQTDINQKVITKTINKEEYKIENHKKNETTNTNKNGNDLVDEIFKRIQTDEPEGLKNFKTINSNRVFSSEFFPTNAKTIEIKKLKSDVVENNVCSLNLSNNHNNKNNDNNDKNIGIYKNVNINDKTKIPASNQLITTNDKSIQVPNENYIDINNLKRQSAELLNANETNDKFMYIPITDLQDNYSNLSKNYNDLAVNGEYNRMNKIYNNDVYNGDFISIDSCSNYSEDKNRTHKYVKCQCNYNKNALDILMPSTSGSNTSSFQNTYKKFKQLDKERSKISSNYLRKLHKSIQKDIFEKSPKYSKTINRIYKNHDIARNSENIGTNYIRQNQINKHHSDPEVQRAVKKFLNSLNLTNNMSNNSNTIIEKPNRSTTKYDKIGSSNHDNVKSKKLLMCNEITTSTTTTSSSTNQNKYNSSNTTTTSNSTINTSLDKLMKLYGNPSHVKNSVISKDSITYLKNNSIKYINNSDSNSCSFSIDNTFIVANNPVLPDNKQYSNRKKINFTENSSSSSDFDNKIKVIGKEKSKNIKMNTTNIKDDIYLIESLSHNNEEHSLLSEIILNDDDEKNKLKINNEIEKNLSDGEIKSLGEI